MPLYLLLTTIPHGSGLPFSQARAAGLSLMYEVSAQVTSEFDESASRTDAAADAPTPLVIVGLSAWNSGSRVMLSGLVHWLMPDTGTPGQVCKISGSALATLVTAGYDSVSSLASSRGSSRR